MQNMKASITGHQKTETLRILVYRNCIIRAEASSTTDPLSKLTTNMMFFGVLCFDLSSFMFEIIFLNFYCHIDINLISKIIKGLSSFYIKIKYKIVTVTDRRVCPASSQWIGCRRRRTDRSPACSDGWGWTSRSCRTGSDEYE